MLGVFIGQISRRPQSLSPVQFQVFQSPRTGERFYLTGRKAYSSGELRGIVKKPSRVALAHNPLSGIVSDALDAGQSQPSSQLSVSTVGERGVFLIRIKNR
jgi:hypothetical protein